MVAIAGDGGLMFTVQELAVAVQQGIGVVTAVLDNQSYGMMLVQIASSPTSAIRPAMTPCGERIRSERMLVSSK